MSAELEAVAAAFRASLPADGAISAFRIDALDRVGVPVVQANLVFDDGEPATSGYGYGPTAIEAEVGALGELCEEVHAGAWIRRAPRIVASHAALVRERGAEGVLDPLTLCLPAGCAYHPDLPLAWVEGRRWPDGAPVLVPREWVAAYPYQLGEAPALITPITNGLGAGLDHAHALAHGLMEALQRDGNVTGYRALDQGVVVDLDGAGDAETRVLLERLRGLGIDVRVKLACTEFGLTNLYVVGDDPGQVVTPIQATACGEASHPDRERALRKALFEFVGSRARKAATHGPLGPVRAVMPDDYYERQVRVAMLEEEEGRALKAMAEWVTRDAATLRARLAPVFSERRRVPFAGLPTVAAETIATGAARLALLGARLGAEGLPVVHVDLSPGPDSPVKVAKAIVPGLECETMSYHRIGWRGVRRLRDRADPLVLDAPREGAGRVLLRAQDEERAGGPAWFDAVLADRLVGDLYPLYRESGPFSAQLLNRQRAEAGAA